MACMILHIALVALITTAHSLSHTLTQPLTESHTPRNHNSILWCKQSTKSPPYNLQTGANCAQLDTLIANVNSYDEFRKIFCRIKKHTQFIKFKHVQKLRYGMKKIPNLAYHSLKWSIINLRPDPDQLWLEFGVANGYSVNLTAYIKENVLMSMEPVYGFDWFRGLPEDW
jgi:hypothetical protein